MLIWNRIYKELGISLDGLGKGLMEIAITMSENTRIARLLYQIFELRKKMDKLHIKTGQTVHELQPLPVAEIAENEKIKEYAARLKSMQADVDHIEKEINLLREERVKARLDELTRHMRRGGYTIEEFAVSKDSEALNKSSDELFLQQDGIIIAVIHNDKLFMPKDRMRLSEGDRVYVLSSVNSILEAAAIFTSPAQLT